MVGGGVFSAGHTVNAGPDTFPVPLELFVKNRQRLAAALNGQGLAKGCAVLLQGGDAIPLYNTDIEYQFRQEPFFMWASGVLDPGCYMALELGTCSAILFVPKLPEGYEIWTGKVLSLEEYRNKYRMDEVYYVDEMVPTLLGKGVCKLLLMNGTNTDSKLEMKPPQFEGIERFTKDIETLYPVISECRVFKTELELEVMRHVNRISSEAHKHVMHHVRPGMNERDGEAAFLSEVYSRGGCRFVAYTCICGAGERGAFLHYGRNDGPVRDGDMLLFDMGASYMGYASDITCSFPANGRFSDRQKVVYSAVYKGYRAVLEAAKPGACWKQMHRLANVRMLEALAEAGLLASGASGEEMVDAGVAAVFQPHGLGHLMGLDVHDVGGYLADCPSRPTEPGFRALRTARVLQPGMVLTIEPGCYFIPGLIRDALDDPKRAKYLVEDVIRDYMDFGGVRIEDNVVVTRDGVENLTQVPRTIKEIEDWMAKRK